MKNKINNTHAAFIAMGLVVILGVIALINIASIVNKYGNRVGEISTMIGSKITEISKEGDSRKEVYLTQVEINSIKSQTDNQTTYLAYCEQYNEEIEIAVDNKYSNQIAKGWNYRVARTVENGELESLKYSFIFDNKVDGSDISNIQFDKTGEFNGVLVDKKESEDTSGNKIYVFKIHIQDGDDSLYIKSYATEKQFNEYEVADTMTITKGEGKIGLNTTIIVYTL